MKYDLYMPVHIVSGKGCVRANPELFKLGSRCVIVTGKRSAKASGALADVTAVLEANGTQYTIYDAIRENPLLSVCREGGKAAAGFGAEFVIGIGGGSPLDASKAIAAFAGNPGIAAEELFGGGLAPSLPIIAVPTTAGTGSEVNPYSILSLDGKNRKKTFNSQYSYARCAFLDSGYTESLGLDYTVSCALDAFCHCVESLMSPKSSEHSRMYALWGAKTIWRQLKRSGIPDADVPDADGREALLYASCAGGIAINTTGTGFPHPLGYNLTMLRGVPHGRACGAFMREYLDCCGRSDRGAELISELCAALECDAEEIKVLIPRLADVKLRLSDAEIEEYIANVRTAGNFKNCCTVIGEDDMREIYRRLFTV